ncbi:glycoside hydrolase family 2 TIM barrel-domain containing protein [Lactobacillus selangorensis]|nr:glycoside hydrolase family 2 TIM barrel-domain containing protein [Lactobacillus selangorensis]
MRQTKNLANGWQFHYGNLPTPNKLVRKAHSLGGMTSALPNEGKRLPVSTSGEYFLKLIAQGDVQQGLQNLAGTDLSTQLDGDWEPVSIPHDWKKDLPYVQNPALLMSGSKENGTAYYRLAFELTSDPDTERITLHFDGVMGLSDVWLNGTYLGHNNSGYTAFDFDITEMANYDAEGPNILLVRVDTTAGAEGWWYEGAGLYRKVWLEKLPAVHLNADDAYIYTQTLNGQNADLGIELSVTNERSQPVSSTPKVQFNNQTITFESQSIQPGETAHFKTTSHQTDVTPWTPENPHNIQATFIAGDDQVTKHFGIHTFAYTTAGFFLNGKPYVLKGVCEHQDFAGVGVALDQDIINYKVKLLKEMGVNALRSSHHFAAPELLNACDQYGILVIDENRILESTPWRLADLKKMVRRQRMHSSIAFWSLGNEELIGSTELGGRILKRLARLIKQYDHEHLTVSAELLNPEGKIDENYLENVDILGVNYPEADVMGDGALKIHANFPQQPIMSTESGSYFQTRGIYRDNAEQCQANSFGSDYSMVMPGKRKPGEPGVGGTARPEKVIQFAQQHPEFGGVFLWTAFDYNGEPSPFGWPGISSQFGILDLCGFPKDYYYYFQAHWTDKPMIHVMPHWNREGLEIAADGTVAVRIFSNAPTVELFINGVSQGQQQVKDCQMNWQVTYQPGELRAVALEHDQVVAETIEQTADSAVKVVVSVRYHGQQDTLYALQAVDQNDVPVPTSDQFVTLHADGAILGWGNGNPADISVHHADELQLFNGKALIIAPKETTLMATLSK